MKDEKQKTKSAVIAIIGRPSSGKSTLLNYLCNAKVSIVAPSPQTTRNKIRGIINRTRGQIVFIDTPGFHKSDKKLNQHLRNLVISSLNEVDLVLYLIDISKKIGDEELETINLLLKSTNFKEPVIIALNKSDMEENYFAEIKLELDKYKLIHEPVLISAKTGENIDTLIDVLFDFSPEGQRLYPENLYTDQNPEFRISEIIREKAVNKTFQELPHSLFVEILDMEMKEGILWVRGFIFVERESQKGILIGKKGSVLKQIINEAQRDFKEIFPYKIFIDLRVKVKPKWRKMDNILKRLIT